jgi:hypothetical protein
MKRTPAGLLLPISYVFFASAAVAAPNGDPTEGGLDLPDSALALMVTSSAPAAGAINVSRSVSPSLTFNASVDPATVTSANISLQGPMGPQDTSPTVSGIVLTIRPTTPLLPLANYTLTIGTGLRGVLGEQLAAPVSIGFKVTEAHWLTAAALENDGGDAYYPQVAMDASGDALAIWSQSDGVRYSIRASRYTAGIGWGTPELVEHDDGGDAKDPQIAFDSDGNALAVWDQYDLPRDVSGATASIWSNRYVSGQGWGVPEPIETLPNYAALPRIAMDPSGNAMAVWWQENAAGVRQPWANRYSAGLGWGTAELLGPANGPAYATDVAFDPNGNAMAIWTQYDDGLKYLWSNRYTAGVGWGTAVKVVSASSKVSTPHLQMDGQGNAMAVWSSPYDLIHDAVWVSRFTLTGGWGAPVALDPNWVTHRTEPTIALDANGNALALWSALTVVPGGQVVRASRYTAGASWSSAEIMSGSWASRPAVVMHGRTALAIWSEQERSGSTSIVSRRYVSGTGWSSYFQVQSTEPPTNVNQQLAFDGNGNALAVWTRTNGTTGWDIYFNRFE